MISPRDIVTNPNATVAAIRTNIAMTGVWIQSVNEAVKSIRDVHPEEAILVYRALIETAWRSQSMPILDQLARAFNALALIAAGSPALANDHWSWADGMIGAVLKGNPTLVRIVVRSRHYAGYRPQGWIDEGDDFPVAALPRDPRTESDIRSADIRYICTHKTAPRLRKAGINTMGQLLDLSSDELARFAIPGETLPRLEKVRARVKALRATVGQRYPAQRDTWVMPEELAELLELAYNVVFPRRWKNVEAEYEILLAGEDYMTSVYYRWDFADAAGRAYAVICSSPGDIYDDLGDRIYRQRKLIGAGYYDSLEEADAAVGLRWPRKFGQDDKLIPT